MVTRSGSSARLLRDPRLVIGRGAAKISYSAVRDYVADRRSPLADLASYLHGRLDRTERVVLA
jgi:hypothetical protein